MWNTHSLEEIKFCCLLEMSLLQINLLMSYGFPRISGHLDTDFYHTVVILLCFCPSTLALDERHERWDGHCVIKLYCIQISKDSDTISKSLKIFIQFCIGYPNTCTWCGIHVVICSWLYELLMSLRMILQNLPYASRKIFHPISRVLQTLFTFHTLCASTRFDFFSHKSVSEFGIFARLRKSRSPDLFALFLQLT